MQLPTPIREEPLGSQSSRDRELQPPHSSKVGAAEQEAGEEPKELERSPSSRVRRKSSEDSEMTNDSGRKVKRKSSEDFEELAAGHQMTTNDGDILQKTSSRSKLKRMSSKDFEGLAPGDAEAQITQANGDVVQKTSSRRRMSRMSSKDSAGPAAGDFEAQITPTNGDVVQKTSSRKMKRMSSKEFPELAGSDLEAQASPKNGDVVRQKSVKSKEKRSSKDIEEQAAGDFELQFFPTNGDGVQKTLSRRMKRMSAPELATGDLEAQITPMDGDVVQKTLSRKLKRMSSKEFAEPTTGDPEAPISTKDDDAVQKTSSRKLKKRSSMILEGTETLKEDDESPKGGEKSPSRANIKRRPSKGGVSDEAPPWNDVSAEELERLAAERPEPERAAAESAPAVFFAKSRTQPMGRAYPTRPSLRRQSTDVEGAVLTPSRGSMKVTLCLDPSVSEPSESSESPTQRMELHRASLASVASEGSVVSEAWDTGVGDFGLPDSSIMQRLGGPPAALEPVNDLDGDGSSSYSSSSGSESDSESSESEGLIELESKSSSSSSSSSRSSDVKSERFSVVDLDPVQLDGDVPEPVRKNSGRLSRSASSASMQLEDEAHAFVRKTSLRNERRDSACSDSVCSAAESHRRTKKKVHAHDHDTKELPEQWPEHHAEGAHSLSDMLRSLALRAAEDDGYDEDCNIKPVLLSEQFRLMDRDQDFHQSEGTMNIHRVHRDRGLLAKDPFHILLDMATWKLLLTFSASYMASILWSSFIVWWIAKPCNFGADSYYDALFFTVETMFTIGYGVPDPYFKHCEWYIFIFIYESLVTVVTGATFTGIVYQRISRGATRASTIIFSDKAVLVTKNGNTLFKFQVCEMRRTQLTECHIRCYLYSRTRPHLSKHRERRQEYNGRVYHAWRQDAMRLDMPDDTMGGPMFLVMPCQVVHRIDAWSPILNNAVWPYGGKEPMDAMSRPMDHGSSGVVSMGQKVSDAEVGVRSGCWCDVCGESYQLREQLRRHVAACAMDDNDLEHKALLPRLHADVSAHAMRTAIQAHLDKHDIEIVCILEGIDAVTGSNVQARHSYTADDIKWDKDFVRCETVTDDGELWIDFSQFHDLIPLPPDNSSRYGTHHHRDPMAPHYVHHHQHHHHHHHHGHHHHHHHHHQHHHPHTPKEPRHHTGFDDDDPSTPVAPESPWLPRTPWASTPVAATSPWKC